ncbi:ArsR/SmtB family transcription factor [Methanogenium organophilum]|uniref:Helix-turn-helix domain-containing protein n=1 Tax=Methanogenium organophilum TaxID=2199 RepID=A0A9X9T896_METOG|nr:helix-turn-helix domain-containing protein [Methanogenium organophilum]WAI01480.1 helix-turn-helix domain-containing protein [Methanogenium organophilum]
MTDDGVLVLEPGDERAKKIGKAMASNTANDVLSALSDDELTLSELSERLGQPITTLKYQIENLLDAGLVEIVRTRYSEKGRVVKVYGVRQQVVIMSPGKADLRSVLLKYASLFALIICATLVLLAMAPTFGFQADGGLLSGAVPSSDDVQMVVYSAEEVDATGANAEKASVLRVAAPVPAPMAPGEGYLPPGPAPNVLAIAFFMGGFVVIFLMLLLELVAMYRRQ